MLFQDPEYPTLANYHQLFVRDSECIVKGIVLMGTPLRGSDQAALFTPYIRAIKQINKFSATNDNIIKSLSADQPMKVSEIVIRFQTVIEARKIKLVICCEETLVAGTELVSPIPRANLEVQIGQATFCNKYSCHNVVSDKVNILSRPQPTNQPKPSSANLRSSFESIKTIDRW